MTCATEEEAPQWNPGLPGNPDLAAGPFPHMSLGLEKTFLPWLCCQIPGVCTFSMLAILGVAAAFHTTQFCILTAALTFYIMMWSSNMCIFSAVGAWRMRRDSNKDWHAKFVKLKEEDPDTTDAAHFVILPNYNEEETMLKETLESLGRAPMAQSRVRVILAMEQREGPGVEEKASRLIAETSHLFAGISATFHPPGLRGEIPGKSSNTQWAFHKVLQEYDSKLKAF
jgi:cellulose synthase/poly-beta-1,6-N-acetylglucosamine synthase-like glycosyltransferase